MIKIEVQASENKYAHLDPIVEALISNGNSIVAGNSRWPKTKDGWICCLSNPIDFSFIENEFALPSKIKCYPDRGTIACDTTWSAIIESR